MKKLKKIKKLSGRMSGLIAGAMAMAMAIGSGGNVSFAAGDIGTTQETKEIKVAEAPFDLAMIDVAEDDLDAETMDNVVKALEKYTTPSQEDVLTAAGSAVALTSLWDGIQPVPINESTFPDPILRSIISTSTYDQDGNGILDPEEIFWTYNVHCEATGVRSLQGIECFVNLQGLWCKDNNISSLNLAPFKDLRGLWCSNNPLTEIDITQNPELTWIYCFDCDLTELDVSKNPHMAFIEINTNERLTSMDVSTCRELEQLTIGSCDLSYIDVSNNPNLAHLDIFRNPKLTSLDVTKNTKMKRLDIWDNPLLGTIDTTHNPGLQYYNCAHNNVTSLDLSNNPEITSLNVAYNQQLRQLDLSHLSKLSILHCETCAIEKMDLSNNPQLRFFYGAINKFDYVDFGYCPSLIKTIEKGKYDNEDFHTEAEKEAAFHDPNNTLCWWGQEWTLDFGGEDSTGGDHIFTVWIDKNVQYSIEPHGDFSTRERYSPLDPGVTEQDLLTREIAIQTLYEMAGRPSVSGLTTRFSDVPASSPFYDAICWAEANAIAMGYPDFANSSFGLGKWLTRQDFMFMLMRYAEITPGYERAIDFGRSDDYKDYFDVDYDHWEAVCWNATWNIVEAKGNLVGGKEEQYIDPFGIVTRTEWQKALNRLIEKNHPIPGNVRKWNPPAAPAGLIAVAPTAKDASDGMIKGVDTTMEYSTSPDFNYDVHPCTSDTITGLRSNVYYVRVKETDYQNPGNVAVVVVSYVIENHNNPGQDNPKPGISFPDVAANAWYAGFVQYVAEKGYMKGKEINGILYFAPNDPITRAEFATVLYSKENKPEVTYVDQFSDVKEGKWFTNPVIWAFQNNITKGYGSGNIFGVSDNITREQMAQMFYAYAKAKGYDLSTNGASLDRFADPDKVSSWAVEAMKWATSKGVISGTGDAIPKLNPKGSATRAECAAMIKSFVQKVEGNQ